MSIFVFNGLFITKNAYHYDTLNYEARERLLRDSSPLVVMLSTSFKGENISFLKSLDKAKIILWGTFLETRLDELPENIFVINPLRYFGSEQYLYKALENDETGKKAIFRYVMNDKYVDNFHSVTETKLVLSSLLFELLSVVGKADRYYAKTFAKEDSYRFNALISLTNDSIFFFETKKTEGLLPQKSWEYCFKGGIIDSDENRDTPLLVSNGTFLGLDAYRLTGDEKEVREKLEEMTRPLKDISKTEEFLLAGKIVREFFCREEEREV